jgi:hypothetical protein
MRINLFSACILSGGHSLQGPQPRGYSLKRKRKVPRYCGFKTNLYVHGVDIQNSVIYIFSALISEYPFRGILAVNKYAVRDANYV